VFQTFLAAPLLLRVRELLMILDFLHYQMVLLIPFHLEGLARLDCRVFHYFQQDQCLRLSRECQEYQLSQESQPVHSVPVVLGVPVVQQHLVPRDFPLFLWFLEFRLIRECLDFHLYPVFLEHLSPLEILLFQEYQENLKVLLNLYFPLDQDYPADPMDPVVLVLRLVHLNLMNPLRQRFLSLQDFQGSQRCPTDPKHLSVQGHHSLQVYLVFQLVRGFQMDQVLRYYQQVLDCRVFRTRPQVLSVPVHRLVQDCLEIRCSRLNQYLLELPVDQ